MMNSPSLLQALTRGSAAWARPLIPRNVPTRSDALRALRDSGVVVRLMFASFLVETFFVSKSLSRPLAEEHRLSDQALAATNEGLQHRGKHDDRGGGKQLQGRRDVVELEHVGERSQHDRAGDGADHRTGTAEEARAADHHGGDR